MEGTGNVGEDFQKEEVCLQNFSVNHGAGLDPHLGH